MSAAASIAIILLAAVIATAALDILLFLIAIAILTRKVLRPRHPAGGEARRRSPTLQPWGRR